MKKNIKSISKIFIVTVLVVCYKFSFGQWGQNGDHIYNTNTGNVGIGVTSPSYGKFQISGEGEGEGLCIYNGTGSTLRMYRKNDIGFITRAGDDSKGIAINSSGYIGIGSTNPTGGKLQISGEGAGEGLCIYDGTGSTLRMYRKNDIGFLTRAGDDLRGIAITGNGNIGINTTTPDYKLDVNGTIRAKEIKVATGWSDFVFDTNYDLPTLNEVEQYIAQHNHLPEIPSAAEVEENGISLGEMNAKLLQKIEELTLYVIEQNKKIVYLNDKNNEKDVLVQELMKRIERLEENTME